jgi:Uma2 family endonuclease
VDVPFTARIPNVTEEMYDEWVDADTRAELFDGQMIVYSHATPAQDAIGGFFRALMRFYAAKKGLGHVFGPAALLRPAPGQRFNPNAFFIASARMPHPLPERYFEFFPDMVVEFLSGWPHDEKWRSWVRYRAGNVPEVWMISPREQRVYQAQREKRYTDATISTGRVTSAVLPGFWVETGWLWADPMPNILQCFREILGES